MPTFKLTDYNFQQTLDSAEVVLVKFSASWCQPCKKLDPILEELSSEITIGKLDIEDYPNVSDKYGVMSLPTMIVFKNGEVVGQTTGFKTKDQILSLVKESI